MGILPRHGGACSLPPTGRTTGSLHQFHSSHRSSMNGKEKPPRKAACPKTAGAKGKTTAEEHPESGVTEKKHNGTTRDQKPPNHTKEESSEQSRQKRKTKDLTEDISKTPPGDTKAPSRRARAKTPGAGKPPKRSELETPQAETADSIETTDPPVCAGRDKSPEDTTETQQETPKCRKARAKHGPPKEATVDALLSATVKNLRIKKVEKSETAEVVNGLIKQIIEHLKKKSQCFQEVEALPTGSYYENLKICNPDEFDVMLSVPLDRVDIKPFGDDGAFYLVSLKRGNNPLKKFEGEDKILSANKMLNEFRDEVKKSVKLSQGWKVERKKPGCPAVTMATTVGTVDVSLDVVLCIKVKTSWPAVTKDGFRVEDWLGRKVKQDYKRQPYYLVPKYEGRGAAQRDQAFARDAWRISFSHVEKGILMNHGSVKTCCERGGQACCRKDCLKLLKHLLSLLKEGNPSFKKFYSYQAKTCLLHACSSRASDSEWSASSLSLCFKQLVEDFIDYLKDGFLTNFFIPDQNLLYAIDLKTCTRLARRMEEQLLNDFPIFRRQSEE